MNTFANAISTAAQHTKQAPKFEALSGLAGDELRLAAEALNPYRVFGIKKYDAPKAFASSDPVSHTSFFMLLDQLCARELTGNAAKAAVTAMLEAYTEPTAKALMRVLDKDLKCGATVSTFKKIYPEFDVPEFDLMGAEKMAPKYVWQFPCILESKYDGQRAIAIVRDGAVTYLSRSGKTLPHLEGLFDADAVAISKLVGANIIIDGEALAGSFLESIEAKGSNNDAAKAALKFYTFDWMLLSEWEAQACPMPQLVRSAKLKLYIEMIASSTMLKSKSKIAQTLDEAKDFYTEVLKEGINEDGTLNGLGEGLIVKYPNDLYQWNLGGSRGPSWTKWKQTFSFDGRIVNFAPGRQGTKYEHILGYMEIEGVDENGTPFACAVGGGFTDKQRKEFWNDRAVLLNKMIEVEAQEMSLGKDSSIHSLRFPVFIKFRDDKS